VSATGRGGSRRELLVVLGLLSAFGPWSIDMYLPGLPELTRDLHTSASSAQLTLTACLAGLALGQLVSGPLSDAYGRRRPLLVGLVAYTAASAACALAPDIWSLVGLRFVQGAAGSAGIVVSRAVVRDLWGGRDAARVFSILLIVTGLAPIVAPIAGGQVLRLGAWPGIFVALATVGALLLLLAALRVPESLPPACRHRSGLASTLRVFRRLVGDRSFAPHAAAFGLGFAALFAYISGSSFVLENLYGLSPQAFSAVFATNALAMVLVARRSGRLVGRTGPEPLVRVGLVALAAAGAELLATVLLHGRLAAVLVGLFVLAGSCGFVFPNETALALAEHGEVAGSASALLGLAQFGLGAVAAPLVGVAGSRSGAPMAIVIAVCAATALAVHLAWPNVRAR